MVELAQLQVFGHKVQLVASHFRQHSLTEDQGVDPVVVEIDPGSAAGLVNEGRVEICVVGSQNRRFSAEFHEFPDSLVLLRSVRNIGVRDAGELGDLLRDVHIRVDLGVEAVHHLQVFQLDSADLSKAVGSEIKAGGLNVEDDDLVIEAAAVGLFEDLLAVDVVDHIGLHTVDDLEVLGHIVHTVREGLYAAVVGYGHGLMSPGGRSVDQSNRVGNSVHS